MGCFGLPVDSFTLPHRPLPPSYVVPWSEFPIVPSYPHYPQKQTQPWAITAPPSKSLALTTSFPNPELCEDPRPHTLNMCTACFCSCISLSRATPLGRSRDHTSEFPTTSEVPTELPTHSTLVEQFRGGLVFKAPRLLYHSTLGSRVIKKKTHLGEPPPDPHMVGVEHPRSRNGRYRGTSLIRKHRPPWNHHKALGMVLL